MSVIVCPACDLVHRGDTVPLRVRTRCSRCRAPLHRPQSARLDSALALTFSALVFFCIGNAYPLVQMHMNGVRREATLVDAAFGLFQQGFGILAALVLFTTVIAPLTQILSLLYLLLPLRRRHRARYQRPVIRLLTFIRDWTFVEVFMLGAVVALVRLSAFATVVPGVALLCCGLLMMTLAALTNMTSPQQYWFWVERSYR
ncbi:MAG TPA: paraquat-inducible protein A [Steroidobacteraceae bacterium]